MLSLGFEAQEQANWKTISAEVIESSAIEGEHLDKEEVRSSVARRLGLASEVSRSSSRHVDGIANVLVDAIQRYAEPLSQERLYSWHTELFPYGHIELNRNAAIGRWRDSSIRVVSGNIGTPTVHMEGIEAAHLSEEMDIFLDWLERKDKPEDGLLRSALAHLWFVTIHPFEDGNGRIARTIADMVLARDDGIPRRFYSMSNRLRQERKAYYRELERAQLGTLDITDWLIWYLECLIRAMDDSEVVLDSVLRKDRFFRTVPGGTLNERQNKLLNMLFDGFEGNLTVKKWATIGKCSTLTAQRDINELIERGILLVQGGGRSTYYQLVLM